MKLLRDLLERIATRVGVNLRALDIDVRPLALGLVPPEQFTKYYAFYGLTDLHPLHLSFHHSALAGSYFLGQIRVEHSALYKSDVRGDELKRKGPWQVDGFAIPLHSHERISIADSMLVKTLVHSCSHDPASPETFYIKNTLALPFANIHGSPVEGGFLGSFSTIDLTTVRNCVVGDYAYVQCGEISNQRVPPGQVLIKNPAFTFSFQHAPRTLARYLGQGHGHPSGLFHEFMAPRQPDFQAVFDSAHRPRPLDSPAGASISRFALVKGQCRVDDNVLVCQRAYLEDSILGPGANAQEHCYLIHSQLEGQDVTAHGAKLIGCRVGRRVFVGFNSLLRGAPHAPLAIGQGSIVLPHTIIDLQEPLEIPPQTLVWGCIAHAADLAQHSIPLERLAASQGELRLGAMTFQGQGQVLVDALQKRIQHILEANGAFCQGDQGAGHAQQQRDISFSTLQPYPEGDRAGIFPTMEIRP